MPQTPSVPLAPLRQLGRCAVQRVQGPRQTRWSVATSLAFAGVHLVRCSSGTELDELGCYSYGFMYSPAMPSVQMPAVHTAAACQAWCRDEVQGCKYFSYHTVKQECRLSADTALLTEAREKGFLSGRAACLTGDANPCLAQNALPDPSFPGSTAEASHQAWASGEQPTPLQCWPRRHGGNLEGFPAPCPNGKVTVLQDTRRSHDNWPGRCLGMKQVDLEEEETCQLRCMMDPVCSVWQLRNASSGPYGTPTYSCWHGLAGIDCYAPSAPTPIVAQRLQHGNFRVLMNTAGMELKHLAKAFDASLFDSWQEGARACRLVCVGYLLCQFWQYLEGSGCFVEDPLRQAMVRYPLVDHPDSIGIGTAAAHNAREGEMIEHYCEDGPQRPFPTEAPSEFRGTSATAPPSEVAPPPAAPASVPVTAGALLSNSTPIASASNTSAIGAVATTVTTVTTVTSLTANTSTTREPWDASGGPPPPTAASAGSIPFAPTVMDGLPSWHVTLTTTAAPPPASMKIDKVGQQQTQPFELLHEEPNMWVKWLALLAGAICVGTTVAGVWVCVLNQDKAPDARDPFVHADSPYQSPRDQAHPRYGAGPISGRPMGGPPYTPFEVTGQQRDLSLGHNPYGP